VADFTWAASGPIITKCLADHGATVVRLESTMHREVRLPGRFAILSETPLGTAKPAQAVGHDRHIVESVNRGAPGVTPRRPAHPLVESGSVFAGIKVADFTWAASGPIITKCLADHGATVVRLESTMHPDSIRMGGPFKDGIPGPNRSGFFADFNTSKKSIVVDLNTSEGRQIARRLVDWADVLTESYTPGVMAKFGLDYETLRKDRPDLVMFSTCIQGQTGRYARYAGYGGQGAALAGLHYVTGWPDLDPAGPKGAYTDSIAPRFGIAALVAALAYRDRTGRGQHIDLSQIEVALQFMAPELLDYQAHGEVAGPMGNRSVAHAPHGAYPCRGDDRWVAIGVKTHEQFLDLANVIDEPAWLEDSSLRSLERRRERQDELDHRIAAWTSRLEPGEAMHLLQRAGVPAGAVQRPSDLLVDPQLAHRGHFWSLDHPELGHCLYNGSSFQLSRTPAWPRSSAPLLGHHTREVLTDYLGYSDADVDDFAYSQILQ
jgi:benzylsuccinate CoA-transferase BbsF subunit